VRFLLLVGGAFAFLTIPRAAQPGMFVDGVTYASIARNLAAGVGSFWAPSYTATVYPVFREHPPLGFALEAAAFAAFGDHLGVERACSILFGVATALLMMRLWRRTTGLAALEWVPVVFWLLPSTVTWGIVNNLLEPSQTMFTTAAVLAFALAMQSRRASMAWAGVAGAAIVCAFLVKGPTGLFPLAAPLVAAAVFPDRRRVALRIGLVMVLAVAVAAVVLLGTETSRAALAEYWNRQVVASLQGMRGGGRWGSVMRHLLAGVLLRMALLLALVWALVRIARGAGGVMRRAPDRWTWFFLGMAVSGSLPVAVSARVSGHYLVPAIPMFALAFGGLAASVLAPTLSAWVRPGSIAGRIAVALGAVLLAAAVALPLAGVKMEPRDVEWMADYRRLAPSMPRSATIATCEAASDDWGSHAYLQRFFRVSLDPGSADSRAHFLQFLERSCDAPPGCFPEAAASRLALLACGAR
jgi:4-amino-4-deoxy-L-arabinose transferase-like glycosyltransferase